MHRASSRRLYIATVLVASLAAAPAGRAEPLSPEQFRKLHKEIRPQPGEWKWAELPWMTNLWAARQKAAAEGKPLFVWTTGPHPLGNL